MDYTVGLIYYWMKQLCLEKKTKNNLTKVVYFTCGTLFQMA